MDGKTRIRNILAGKPVDRIGVYEHFWADTEKAWRKHLKIDDSVSFDDLFKFDMSVLWSFNMIADLDFTVRTLDETKDTVTFLDGNGITIKRHKHHDATSENIDFEVKDRESWENYKHFLIEPDRRRIKFDKYRQVKKSADMNGRFFLCSSYNVFEYMHTICGHENLLIGMALDPDWIKDMAETYASMIIRLQNILFSEEGMPDGVWFYEDLGYKERSFISPEMYRDLIQPFHKSTIDFAHQKGLPVIFHSCGCVDSLIPDFIDSGIDCLQAIEIKSGMNLLDIYKRFGDKIALMGGIDARVLLSNDLKLIDKELESKLPLVKDGYGYILHSDHSLPPEVEIETYKYFLKKGLELCKY